MAGRRALPSGLSTLYVVATPIGNLEDVSQRAIRVLGEVSAIAAEDTRVTGRLLARYAIRKPMISYRAPVQQRTLGRVLDALEQGDVALVSDAGTPAVSDPGTRLVEAAAEAGYDVVAIPGPSAVAAAVSVSGFGGPGFVFAGYLPRKPGELRRFFGSLGTADRMTVVFESPHRIQKSLSALAEVLPERRVVVCRELTKMHEQVVRGTAAEVAGAVNPRGEFVIVIDRAAGH
jgi:16S rRNA (cytidine1402-2'-O)-methyltransferase